MSNYREAKCIELHDANLALTTYEESYEFTAPTGRTDHADKPAFSVKFCDIAMLAQMLGTETTKTVDVPKLSEQPLTESGKRAEIDFVEFPIYKVHHDYSGSTSHEKIIKIECQIISDRLVNIKTTATYEEDKETHTEEITYCGAFTIWWAKS